MRDPTAAVFTGPSLAIEEARELLEHPALVLPPIQRGDLGRLPDTVRVVLILDGVFYSDQAVSPREILLALRDGIQVLGASSMGALRAAELEPFGMVGVGEVYDAYRAGELQSDADVALLLDPDTQRALTEPVVNVMHMMDCARDEGMIDDKLAGRVVAAARGLYFGELTYPRLFQQLLDEDAGEQLEQLMAFVANRQADNDLKRKDALAAMRALNEVRAGLAAAGA
jgi:hypothetical protein